MTVIVKQPRVVAFDFDGTLTYGESFFRFLWFVTPAWRFVLGALKSLPVLCRYALKMTSNAQAKEQVVACFLAGQSAQVVQSKADAFAHDVIPRTLRPQAVARLHGHLKQGHVCALVSATLAIYLRPWAHHMGFDTVLATELEVDANGRYTGKLATPNCYGPEKAVRLREHYKIERILAAYGDTRGDREMLALAEQAHFRPWH
ncbi:MAG: HAD-IB family hydrolase [Moraxellaceae bacterium]|nr:HAD-IB family hydrolase [Moraxellaceae bacterium]MDP1775051.1 HAD-IB family hydrolase [Moraxellaceae bacterium]